MCIRDRWFQIWRLLPENDSRKNVLFLKTSAEGQYDINIIGKVLDISVVRTFEKKNGSSGRIRNLLLGDATGKISVSLWDEKIDFLGEVNFDETVEVPVSYTHLRA